MSALVSVRILTGIKILYTHLYIKSLHLYTADLARSVLNSWCSPGWGWVFSFVAQLTWPNPHRLGPRCWWCRWWWDPSPPPHCSRTTRRRPRSLRGPRRSPQVSGPRCGSRDPPRRGRADMQWDRTSGKWGRIWQGWREQEIMRDNQFFYQFFKPSSILPVKWLGFKSSPNGVFSGFTMVQAWSSRSIPGKVLWADDSWQNTACELPKAATSLHSLQEINRNCHFWGIKKLGCNWIVW